MTEQNPCMTCGAGCAHFRVSFYWEESSAAPGGTVPSELTDQMHPHLVCMKGTNQHPPRCIALRGEVGKQVSCAIYAQRPSPCREFNVYELDSSPNIRCFKLRGRTPES